MALTLSYDLQDVGNNDRNYIRSMLERFHWQRLGGSVFRYDGVVDEVTGQRQEDWLNHVAPSLMFLRSYVVRRNITIRFFTIDAASTSFLDHSDPAAEYGAAPANGAELNLTEPTNLQSSVETIRGFIDASTAATA